MAAAALDYVLESAPVLALCLDANLEITAANTYAYNVLGKSVLGRPFAWCVVDFSQSTDLRALTAQRTGIHMLGLNTAVGMPETYFFRFFTLAHGTLALGSLDVQDLQRLRSEALGLNRELNDLARQLHQANAELRELNQLKNQFLGMAAHDLRQPLGSILVFGQYVIDEAGAMLSAEHQDFLRTCIRSAEDMKRLIDDFLDVAMIESGRLRLELSPARVEEILGPVATLGRLLAARKGVSLLLSPSEGTRRLLADAPKVQQVLLNLVGNAVNHSATGQRVWLSASWEPQNLVLTVRDEGPGIALEQQQRLFAPFERLAHRRTAGERHAGLGLAIAQKIVEAHHGAIRVESILGQGASFFVTLPASGENECSQTATQTP